MSAALLDPIPGQRPHLAMVEQGIQLLQQDDPEQLDDDTLRHDIRWCAVQQRALEAVQARMLAALDRRQRQAAAAAVDDAAEIGLERPPPILDPSCEWWLQEHLRLTSNAAYAQIRTARQLDLLPSTADAFRRGLLNAQQVQVICRAMEQLPRTCLEPAATEQALLLAAQTMDPRQLLRYWLQLRYQADQEAGLSAEQARHRRRFLHIRQTWEGDYRVEGLLDSEHGALFQTAIREASRRRGKDDDRTPAQRRADAAGDLARYRLDAGDLPRRARQRPHLLLVADLQTLRLEPGSRLAQLDWGPLVTGHTARRIACDAELTPILTNGQGGDVLHVGRRARTLTLRQRKALDLRDQHCQAPGCTATPDRCVPHHREHWVDGGTSDIPNTGLYCSVHHPRLHPENQRFRNPPPNAP
jgi:Domain of unknown function (DUF222)